MGNRTFTVHLPRDDGRKLDSLLETRYTCTSATSPSRERARSPKLLFERGLGIRFQYGTSCKARVTSQSFK